MLRTVCMTWEWKVNRQWVTKGWWTWECPLCRGVGAGRSPAMTNLGMVHLGPFLFCATLQITANLLALKVCAKVQAGNLVTFGSARTLSWGVQYLKENLHISGSLLVSCKYEWVWSSKLPLKMCYLGQSFTKICDDFFFKLQNVENLLGIMKTGGNWN